MEDQFVPYELAVKLKELGYDNECFKSYIKLERHEFEDLRSSSIIVFNEDEPINLVDKSYSYSKNSLYLCKAPLWQQAFDWFRIKHKYTANILQYIDKNGEDYFIYNIQKVICVPRDTWSLKADYKIRNYTSEYTKNYNYKQARQACLEKLIELITK